MTLGILRWELKHKLNPRSKADAKADHDGDGLPNVLEYRLGGNPRDEDTDNDGQDDGDERGTRTKVDKADSDRDRILDGDEAGRTSLVAGTGVAELELDGKTGAVDEIELL